MYKYGMIVDDAFFKAMKPAPRTKNLLETMFYWE
jgi:hypothetical protein